jgi:hypothetical protein
VSGVSQNRGGFVKCVAIQKMLGIPVLDYGASSGCGCRRRPSDIEGSCEYIK